MKKRIIFLFTTLLACIIPNAKIEKTTLYASTSYGTSDYLNEQNWINLPGYEYITNGVKVENDGKLPAEVTYGKDVNEEGINLKIKGYYQTGVGDEYGNQYTGLVYKNKVSLDDFSITFTVNKQGASSNASPADDGWISVAFLKNANMFSTTNVNINMGAVALIRPSSRGAITYLHEIAEDGSYKISNFAKGTNVSTEIDTLPSFEGSTIRVSFVKEESATGYKVYLKMEQIDFETKKVLVSKTTAQPFECPQIYADENDMGYLAISASSDNFDKSWDISIKNICGVDVGLKKDEEPISATQRAENIYSLIENLQIYSYFDLSGNLSDDGMKFYSYGSEIDVNQLITDLSIQLYNADSDTLAKLITIDAVSSQFTDSVKYLEFLNSCCDKIITNYEDSEINNLIENINYEKNLLPSIEEVSLTNEQLVTNAINNLQTYYGKMNEKAINKYGKDNYDKLWNEIIVPYSDKLKEVLISKYLSLVNALPNNATKDNQSDVIMSLVPAELIYQKLEKELVNIEIEDKDNYQKIIKALEKTTILRNEIDTLKENNKREIEALENAARVNYDIYYLPIKVTADDAQKVFEVLNRYSSLSTQYRTIISEKETLLDVSAKALEALISSLPEENNVTKDNYINLGYDTLITTANNYYAMLEEIDSEYLKNISNKEKLQKLVNKVSALKNPLSSNIINQINLKCDEKYDISFVSMFNNYFGRNYEVTSNYGTIDKSLETISLSFSDNGTYEVEVKIKDIDFDQESTCKFSVVVSGKEEPSNNKSGCKGSVDAGMFITLLGVLLLKSKKK